MALKHKKYLFLYLLALAIPCCLFWKMYVTQKYIKLENEVRNLEELQYDSIEYNKRLISEISVKTVPSRIETIAREEMGMRPALPEEVIRIKIAQSEVQDE